MDFLWTSDPKEASMTERQKIRTQSQVKALRPEPKPYDVRFVEPKGFLLRVHPGGARAFYFDYRLKGWPAAKRARLHLGEFSRSGLSVEGARTLAKSAAGDVAKGIDIAARRKEQRQGAERALHSTLRAFLDGKYEPWARDHLKSAAFQLARLRSDFVEQLDKPLDSFDMLAIEALRRKWRAGGKQPRTINRDLQRLSSVLSRAVAMGVIERHPFKGLKLLKVDKAGRVRFLSTEEEGALREALDGREARLREAHARFNKWRRARHLKPVPERRSAFRHLRPLVLVALNTGLRRGELLGLTWGAVDLPGEMLTVRGSTAKSGHTRRVPLNGEALAVLREWHEQQGKPGPEALVFAGPGGERMTRVDTSWRSLVRAAGVKDFRLHDCRHHFASRLVQSGVDLYTVKTLLGHSEITMTERYGHLAPGNLRAAVERIAGGIGS
jgi:integrase